MLKDIKYKCGNIAGAKLYIPKDDSDVLMVWCGGGCLYRWDMESLGKHIKDKVIAPACYVLMPYCKSRKSLADVSAKDAAKVIGLAVEEIGHSVTIRLCGYSMGDNAICQWMNAGMKCDRFALISNYPHEWVRRGTIPLDVPMRAYYGGAEKSRVQNWKKLCSMFKVGKSFVVGKLDHGQMARKFWLTNEGKECLAWIEGGEKHG